MSSLFVTNTTRQPTPSAPFAAIKNDILGTEYELSLSFVGETRAQKINQQTRQKDYIPNVLSFPLSDSIGEIYICPRVAARQAAEFELSTQGHIIFLFIHGCLHLKGHDHGATMEKQELQYLRKYAVK